MFRKEFKVKSNCQLKSCDKKKLTNGIFGAFPTLSEEKLQSSFPAKNCVNQMKLVTHNGELVTVFLCNGRPLIVEIHTRIIPTVYFLWTHPELIHSFLISQYVMDKLINGADLMLPGIIKINEQNPYGEVKLHEIVSVHTPDNNAAIAIGLSLMSSVDMLNSNGRGKAVGIYHTIGDGLFKLATEKMEMPLQIDNIENTDTLDKNETEESKSLNLVDEDLPISNSPDLPSVMPDEVLTNSFLHCIKVSHDKITLPILTNLFYKNYLLKSVPPNIEFDIKKTTYKKLSTFLTIMEKEGIIKLLTTPKNVQSIVEIDYKHPLLLKFVNIFQDLDHPQISESNNQLILEISENYVVNSRVQHLFSNSNYKKGDLLTLQDVRKAITDYVKSESLSDPNNKGLVILDPVLTKVIQGTAEIVEWRYLMDKIIGNMSNYFEVKKNGVIINSGKGNVPLIEVYVRLRKSNKKVTIVDNLETYGIDLVDISKECQHGLAASTSTNKVPNKKGFQFQVQGSHMSYIKTLLIDKYCIPKKFINENCDYPAKR